MSDLLPCPCCGSEARMHKKWSEHYNGKGKMFFFVKCKKSTCALTSQSNGSAARVADKWNTRAPITTNEVNQPLLKGEND